MIRSVEFDIEALEDLEDLPQIARQLTRLADWGRVACGQPDPTLLELQLGEKRLLYRIEGDEVWVLSAERVAPTCH